MLLWGRIALLSWWRAWRRCAVALGWWVRRCSVALLHWRRLSIVSWGRLAPVAWRGMWRVSLRRIAAVLAWRRLTVIALLVHWGWGLTVGLLVSLVVSCEGISSVNSCI